MRPAILPALLPLAHDPSRAAVERFAVVAVISGRPTDHVRALLGVDGVRYLGCTGWTRKPSSRSRSR